MRSVISETGVEVFTGGGRETPPPSTNLLRKLGRWLFTAKPAVELHDTAEEPKQNNRVGLISKIRHGLLEYGKASYRRDTFFYSEGLGHLPQRALKRHSAFLVYQKKYYQSIEQSRLNKS